MYSLNQAQVIGNLTSDPEMRQLDSGSTVTTFSIATNRKYTVNGQEREDTQYHNIVTWGKLAEICNNILRKGNKVFVTGRMQTRSWDAKDGSKRTKTEIVADDFILLTPKGKDEFAENVAEALI